MEGGANSVFLYSANHDDLRSGIVRHRKSKGIIAPSFTADIIALKSNPLDDIDAVKQVHFVMKDGKIIKQEK